MRTYIQQSKFIVRADDNNQYDYISIKDIKKYCKALEVLGIEEYKIYAKITFDETIHKHITEEDYKKLNALFDSYDSRYAEIKIVNDIKVQCMEYVIRVNKDESFDYQGEYNQFILAPIRYIEIVW